MFYLEDKKLAIWLIDFTSFLSFKLSIDRNRNRKGYRYKYRNRNRNKNENGKEKKWLE